MSDFTINRYETWELDELLKQVDYPEPWLVTKFFGRQKFFESATIEWDVLDRTRRMAPFVSPLVGGVPMKREGYSTASFNAAYIKPTDLLLPSDTTTRRPGETYGGKMTRKQRFDALVAETMALHQMTIDTRLEWMAAQVLVNSAMTVSGEGYPAVNVNFGRSSALSLDLTGQATAWDQPGADPMTDIETMALQTRLISKGAVVTDIVMSGDTWSVLRYQSGVTRLIDTRFRRDGGSKVDTAPRSDLNTGQYVGNLGGRFDLWVLDSYVNDEDGNNTALIPSDTLVGISPAMEGTQYFGAIEDLDADMKAVRSFSKSKKKFNPSGLELVTQSAPLLAPRRPNATFKIKVK